MKQLITSFVLMTLTFFVNADKRYVPPNSDYGKLCVNQCTTSKYQCQQLEELKNDNARLRDSQDDLYWQQGRSSDLQRCLTKRSDAKGKKKCRDRYDDDEAIEAGFELLDLFLDDSDESTPRDICKEQYISCFTNCGGRIEKINVDKRYNY